MLILGEKGCLTTAFFMPSLVLIHMRCAFQIFFGP